MLNGVKCRLKPGIKFHRMKSIATILVFKPILNDSRSRPVSLPNIWHLRVNPLKLGCLVVVPGGTVTNGSGLPV